MPECLERMRKMSYGSGFNFQLHRNLVCLILPTLFVAKLYFQTFSVLRSSWAGKTVQGLRHLACIQLTLIQSQAPHMVHSLNTARSDL